MDQVVARVEGLLEYPQLLETMRRQARAHQNPDVSQRIARWLVEKIKQEQPAIDNFQMEYEEIDPTTDFAGAADHRAAEPQCVSNMFLSSNK